MSKCHVILMVGILFTSRLLAQQAAPDPPVKRPPPGSAWVVKVSNPLVPGKLAKDAAKDKPEQKVSLPVLLQMKRGMNNVSQGQISYSDDHRDTFYVYNDSVVVQAAGSKHVYAQSVQSSELDYFSMQVPSFPGIAWIDKSNLKNSEKKNGADCLHYAKTEVFAGGDLKLEAWIGESDHYPVEIKVGDLTYNFETPQPFPEDVAIPDDFRKALFEVTAEQSAIDAMRRARRR